MRENGLKVVLTITSEKVAMKCSTMADQETRGAFLQRRSVATAEGTLMSPFLKHAQFFGQKEVRENCKMVHTPMLLLIVTVLEVEDDFVFKSVQKIARVQPSCVDDQVFTPLHAPLESGSHRLR